MYRGKVVIAGIDTTQLPVMQEDEKIRLLKLMQNGNQEEKESARAKLIGGNLRLVLSVVQRFSGRGESLDDLFQVGCIGLIKAINNFNINEQVKLSTYAVPMIAGEIRRFLRDYAPVRVSRSLKDLAYHVMKTRESLTGELRRDPTITEIAKEMQLPTNEVVLAFESIVEPLSLYEPVFSDGGEPICVMDQIAAGSDDEDWIDEITIRDALEALSDREKKIIKMRFFDGMTQVEVSCKIGISQAQVSRLEKGALHKVRASLRE